MLNASPYWSLGSGLPALAGILFGRHRASIPRPPEITVKPLLTPF
jgi:hypothetical protein